MNRIKVLKYNCFEGCKDLEKHGVPRFIADVELAWDCLPPDSSSSESGNEEWRSLLSTIDLRPHSIQRLLSYGTHWAQLSFFSAEELFNAKTILEDLVPK